MKEIKVVAKANVGAQKSKDSAMISPVVIVQIFHERINKTENF